MNCREMDGILAAGEPLKAEARGHLASCARCRALVEATVVPVDEPLSPEVQARLAALVLTDLAPVRPLPVFRYSLLLLACAAGAALTGVSIFGVRGWKASTTLQQVWLIPALVGLALALPALLTQLMIPGALLRINPKRLIAGAVCWFAFAAPLVYPVLMYPGFGRHAFGCLLIGIGAASAVAIAGWLILRRGYVTAPGTAAITVGALGGISSLALQVVYCPQLDTGHFALAHLGSFVLSIVLAGLLMRKIRLSED